MTYFGVANSGEILFSTDDSDLFDFGVLDGDVTGPIHATLVTGFNGFAIPTGAPGTDQILKFNGSEWEYTPDASGTGTTPHALLSTEHSDTVTATVVRGDIIVGNATPNWDALSLGTAEFVLYSDGTDIVYTRLGANTPFELGTFGAPSQTYTGDLDTGWSAAAADVQIGSASGLALLELNGVTQALNLDAAQVVRTNAIGVSYTVAQRDYVIAVTAVPVTITLPAAPVEGRKLIIKDRDGLANAATFILVGGNGNTIDGNISIRIKNKYGSFTLLYSGTEWNVI